MSARFEGSFLGDLSRIAPETRLECKICWSVYDPALGDEIRQIPPGTAFAALPEDWRCPTCDGEREQFMALDAPAGGEDPAQALLRDGPARLKAAFTEIFNAKMRDTPFTNRSLSVEPVAFRAWEGQALGVLVAPWFMNLMLLSGSGEGRGAMVGEKRVFAFPSGDYEFIYNERPELGGYWACSLFSSMGEFASQLQATDTARAVMAALFDPANRADDHDHAREIRSAREAETAPGDAAPGDAAESAAEAGVSRRAVISGGLAEERS